MAKPSIRPVVWTPPARPRGGGSPLPPVDLVDVGGVGPEDVLVDVDGSVLTGLVDGRIVRMSGTDIATVANTGGRPLGLEWLPDRRLLVCDARRGLLAVDVVSGAVELLATEADGRPLVFLNNAAVAADGTIWFTDSSARHPVDHWKAEIAEHSGTGRIVRRDPDGTTHTVVDGLEFPNGITLAPDERSILYVETGSYRLGRLKLAAAGVRIIANETVIGSLPGYPDNIALGSDGLVWIAVASPRDPVMDVVARLPGAVRRIGYALPPALQPRVRRTVHVLAVHPDTGAVVHDLRGRHPGFHMVTGVREHGGTLWLGSLVSPAVLSLTVPRGAPVP